MRPGIDAAPAVIMSALQDQFGLTLDRGIAPVEVDVSNAAKKPATN
jgi:hypothetical protein